VKSTDYFTHHCCSTEISSYSNTGENNAERERGREREGGREIEKKRGRVGEREEKERERREREREREVKDRMQMGVAKGDRTLGQTNAT